MILSIKKEIKLELRNAILKSTPMKAMANNEIRRDKVALYLYIYDTKCSKNNLSLVDMSLKRTFFQFRLIFRIDPKNKTTLDWS